MSILLQSRAFSIRRRGRRQDRRGHRERGIPISSPWPINRGFIRTKEFDEGSRSLRSVTSATPGAADWRGGTDDVRMGMVVIAELLRRQGLAATCRSNGDGCNVRVRRVRDKERRHLRHVLYPRGDENPVRTACLASVPGDRLASTVVHSQSSLRHRLVRIPHCCAFQTRINRFPRERRDHDETRSVLDAVRVWVWSSTWSRRGLRVHRSYRARAMGDCWRVFWQRLGDDGASEADRIRQHSQTRCSLVVIFSGYKTCGTCRRSLSRTRPHPTCSRRRSSGRWYADLATRSSR